MSDITKVRSFEEVDPEIHTRDENGDWRWPGPPECVESMITGDLRTRILSRLGRAADDACYLRLIERDTTGGWSEFTVEMDYDIEVWLDEGRQSQRLFETTTYAPDKRMKAFLDWTETR